MPRCVWPGGAEAVLTASRRSTNPLRKAAHALKAGEEERQVRPEHSHICQRISSSARTPG